jgi:hypothetical protein
VFFGPRPLLMRSLISLTAIKRRWRVVIIRLDSSHNLSETMSSGSAAA